MLHSEDNKFFRQTGRRGGGGSAASPGGEKSKGSLRERGARGGAPGLPAAGMAGDTNRSAARALPVGGGESQSRRGRGLSSRPWRPFSSWSRGMGRGGCGGATGS